jgi:hypothetical protein
MLGDEQACDPSTGVHSARFGHRLRHVNHKGSRGSPDRMGNRRGKGSMGRMWRTLGGWLG